MLLNYLLIKKNMQKVLKLNFLRYRKILNQKRLSFNPQYNEIRDLPLKGLKLSIRVKSNNTFCCLSESATSTVLKVGFSGKYSIKVSQKNVKYTGILVVKNFLKEITEDVKTSDLVVSISCISRIRKKIIKLVISSITPNSLVYRIKSKKCFNGCRAKKKKRKKQKNLRIFK